MQSKQIEALLIERLGYERRGLKDRVEAVDKSLRELGYANASMNDKIEATSVEQTAERAIQKRVQKRAN